MISRNPSLLSWRTLLPLAALCRLQLAMRGATVQPSLKHPNGGEAGPARRRHSVCRPGSMHAYAALGRFWDSLLIPNILTWIYAQKNRLNCQRNRKRRRRPSHQGTARSISA